MLKLNMIGHIGKDATVREVNGKMVISFSVAHSDDYIKDGIKIEKTIWVRCDLWRDRNNINIASYLKKGTQVYIEGSPQVSTYVSREGNMVASIDCKVTRIELLSGSRKTDTSNTPNTQTGNINPGLSSEYDKDTTTFDGLETVGTTTNLQDDDDLPF